MTVLQAKLSKLEINISRLLTQCELLSSNKNDQPGWRLEKYVNALDELLSDLKNSPSCPSKDVLAEYRRRVDFLKGILQTEKLSSPIEKAMANQLVSPGISTSGAKLSREIHLQTTSRYNKEMRAELLGDSTDGLKHRNRESSSSEDFDSVLKYHQNVQDKLAEDMLALARNMKENSMIANSLVKRDIETLDKSSKYAENNFSKLKIESERLEEHTQRACSWWIWVMIAVVCIIFINMVAFMKMFPKS